MLDEDVSHAVADKLRSLGYDVLTVDGAGRKGMADIDQFAFAAAANRTLVTHNRRDFLRLHRMGLPHAGLIICTRDDDDPIGLARRIHEGFARIADWGNPSRTRVPSADMRQAAAIGPAPP